MVSVTSDCIGVKVVSLLFIVFVKQKTAYEMLRSLVGSEMCIRDSGNMVLLFSINC